MSHLALALIFLVLLVGLGSGFTIGRQFPGPKLLDSAFDEGYEMGYQAGWDAEKIYATTPATGHDLWQANAYGIAPPGYALEPDELSDRYKESLRNRAHTMAFELSLPVEAPEYVPDTWLHDELMKLHDWSVRQAEIGRKWRISRPMTRIPEPAS